MNFNEHPFPEAPNPSQGAFVIPGEGVKWCVWAPFAESVTLEVGPADDAQTVSMSALSGGFFEHQRLEAAAGTRYAYRLNGGPPRPDPASRWQPEGVNSPSAVFDPQAYQWHDADWQGVRREDLVIYELHVGTFTESGTFEGVIPRLSELRELGVTAIELLPLAQFSGTRNWGYDGVHPFAVQNSYGGPQGLQKLIDAAHAAGLGVVIDVVYNHLGPEGNYLPEFGPYFTDRYHTPWGSAVNFDGADCDPVRRYVCDNARMWVRDYHADGLRLDAVHAIYDFSARHILADVRAAAHEEASRFGRPVHVIGESDQNDARLTERPEQGGIGLDAVWADELHHSVHSLLTGEREGYYRDFGSPYHLRKALDQTFVYDGQYSPFRRRKFGSSVAGQDRSRFVVCIQNHDQVGNRAVGDRLDALLTPAARRLATALLLVGPGTPMLFMGEEYGERQPFPFFCSFSDPQLVEAVRKGRHEEFAALEFEWGVTVPDPQSEETFRQARLRWEWPEGSFHAGLRRLYRDLLKARRKWAALRDRDHTVATLVPMLQDADMSSAAAPADRRNAPAPSSAQVHSPAALLMIKRGTTPQVTAIANLTSRQQPLPSAIGCDSSELRLSTEARQYGGSRSGDAGGEILPYEMLIFGAVNTQDNH